MISAFDVLQDGSYCKATLAELLREAPEGQPATTTTTIQFFVELADYRGIVGPEVDEAWALLKHTHRQEMILAFARYSVGLYILLPEVFINTVYTATVVIIY